MCYIPNDRPTETFDRTIYTGVKNRVHETTKNKITLVGNQEIMETGSDR